MTHPAMIDSGQINMVPKSRAGNDSLHIPFLGAPATAAIPAHSVQMVIDGPGAWMNMAIHDPFIQKIYIPIAYEND